MGGFWRLSRELAPSQADWFELARFRAAASRRLPGHDLASRLALLSFPCRNIESHASRILSITRSVANFNNTHSTSRYNSNHRCLSIGFFPSQEIVPNSCKVTNIRSIAKFIRENKTKDLGQV